jgi:hypothetical protein
VPFETSTIAQTLAGLTQAGTMAVADNATIAQTLQRLTQSAEAQVDTARTATIAQTLAGLTQSGVLVDTGSACCGAPGKSAALALAPVGKSAAFTPCFGMTPAPAPAPLSISGAPITMADVNMAYTGFTVAASGGKPPYSYSVTAGELPAGITLGASTGVVSGTPTEVVSETGIVITARDETGATASLAAFGIDVAGALEISGTPVTTATQGAPYAGFEVSASGGSGPYVFSIASGALPAGITLDPTTGEVSGSATTVGDVTGIVIEVADFAGATAQLSPFAIDVTAPVAVLSNVAYAIGAMTQPGFGQVRLSSQPGSYTGRGGLGLLSAGKTASSWTVALSSGTAGHWKIGSTVLTGTPLALSEGATAVTPTPTAAGLAAGLDGGPYVFAIGCTATDTTTGTASLTVTSVAHAASFGDTDPLTASMVGGSASAFQTAGGTTLLFSTGANRTTLRSIFELPFAAPAVTLQHADPGRPGLIFDMEFSGCAWLNVTGFTCSDGDFNTTAGIAAHYVAGASNMVFTDCGAVFSDAQVDPLGTPAIRIDGASNVTFDGYDAQQVAIGLVTTGEGGGCSNITFNGLTVRYFYIRAIALANGENLTFNDTVILSPIRSLLEEGLHMDSLQVQLTSEDVYADIVDATFNRTFFAQADGTGYCQGFPFDGWGGGWQVNGLIQCNTAVDGPTFGSMDTTGRATFFKNFTTLLTLSGTPAGVQFTGGVTSGVLTVTTAPSETIAVGYKLSVDKINVSGDTIQAYGTSGTTGTGGEGTYAVPGIPNIAAGTAIVAGEDGSWNALQIQFSNSDVGADWTGAAGSFEFSSGFHYGTVNAITAARGAGALPALIDMDASVIVGDYSTSRGDKQCFTVANPRAAIEATDFAGMTTPEVIAAICANLLPAPGGPLDAGGGNAYGALTFAGEWNDGSGKAPGG